MKFAKSINIYFLKTTAAYPWKLNHPNPQEPSKIQIWAGQALRGPGFINVTHSFAPDPTPIVCSFPASWDDRCSALVYVPGRVVVSAVKTFSAPSSSRNAVRP